MAPIIAFVVGFVVAVVVIPPSAKTFTTGQETMEAHRLPFWRSHVLSKSHK